MAAASSTDTKTPQTLWQRIEDVDKRVSEKLFIGNWPYSQQWRAACRALEFGGHGLPWFLFVGVLLTEALPGVPISVPANLLLALLGDIATVGFLKSVFKRPRPSYNSSDMMTVAAVDHFSFPSGHTTRVVMLAALAHHFGVAPALLSWIYLWAAATSFSRIMLGRHHVLDVAVGVGVGMGVAQLLVAGVWYSDDELLHLLEAAREFLPWQ